tara:strand:+ start:221 stop:475 length:255 start_codon:yes stop_codon:yes gene_type:complete
MKISKDLLTGIDKSIYNLKNLNIKKWFYKEGYLYIEFYEKDLKKLLDKDDYKYLLECHNNKNYISFENVRLQDILVFIDTKQID